MTKAKVLELSQQQPIKEGAEREAPILDGNRFYRFPLEIIFSESGQIQSIKVGDETY